MSLLIKGMEMPKDCASCDLSYYCDGYNGGYGYSPSGWRCRRLNHIIKEGEETRPLDCPLVKIPTPHGRLIDADRLLAPGRIAKFIGGQEIFLADAIRYAPTIVEAEGNT